MPDRPDWAGFFSDSVIRQLPEPEFMEAYQAMAADDPVMANFGPEDHQEFFQIMNQEYPNPAVPQLDEADVAVASAFAPLVGKPPEELAELGRGMQSGMVTEELSGEMLPYVMLAQNAMKGMGLAPPTDIPGLRELARGSLTTVPETLLSLAPGLMSWMDMASETLDDRSKLWKGVKENIDLATTVGVPQAVASLNMAIEQGADAALGPAALEAGAQLQDVKSVGDLFDYVARFGQQAGASAIPVVASALVPVVGPGLSLAVASGFVTGELQMDQFERTGEALPGGEAVVRQTPAAIAEFIGGKGLFKGIKGGARKAISNFIANRGINIAETTATEGGTEFVQQLVTLMNRKDIAGESLDPREWSIEDWRELREATIGGAIGGAGFGTLGSLKPTQAEVQQQAESDMQRFIDMLSPEEAGEEGRLQLTPEAGQVTGGEARLRALEGLPFEIGDKETAKFVRGEPLDIARIAETHKMDEGAVVAAIDEAEQRVGQLAPRQQVQPSQDVEDVVGAIASGLEELAVEAEADRPALAASRRKAAQQVEVVEPETVLERGMLGAAKRLGGAPKVMFFRHGGGVKLEYDGVFVRPGLIAIDVTDGNSAPKATLGALFHELFHNVEATNPEIYNATVEILRGTEAWARAEAKLNEIGAPATEQEIFSTVTQLPDMTVNLLRAFAEYADVEDLAKAPGKVRAVVEYLAAGIRKVLDAFGWTADTTGLPLSEMQRFTAIRQDPELIRNAARHTLAMIDMLKAAPTQRGEPGGLQEEAQEVAAEEAAPTTEKGGVAPEALPEQQRLFSRTFERMRQEEGMTPLALDSIKTETRRYYQVKSDLLDKLLGQKGVSIKEAYERASKGANEWVRKNMKILDPEDLDEVQQGLSEYAQNLGITVNWYEGGSKMHGGHFVTPGQLWVNAKNETGWSFQQIVAHESMHDFKRRYPALWRKVVDYAIKTMPEEWNEIGEELKKNSAYKKLSGEEFHNEQLAFLIHYNATSFWAAVNEAGSKPGAPVAFKRFFSFIGDLVKKLSGPLFEWGKSIGLISLTTDMNSPGEQLGRYLVEQLAKGPGRKVGKGRVAGPYQAYSPTVHEERVEKAKKDYGKATKLALGTNQEEAKLTGRMERDLDRGIARPAKQQTLFSRRVGYPEPAQTTGQLRTWRQRLAKMATAGMKGRFWYEESAAAILQMTGGDLEMARKFARLVAVYSPQTGVIVNWHRALTAWQRYLAGYSREDFLKEQLGNEANHIKAADILYEDKPWSGEKTNSFFNNLFTLLDSEIPDTATIDIWMMRAMGFSGDAPTPKQYKEMEAEVKRVAKKLGVETHQAQAMIWVYSKTVWESMLDDVLAAAERQDMITHVPDLKKDGTPKKVNGKIKMIPTPEYMALYREMFQAELKRDLKADMTKYPISEAAMTTFATGLQRKTAVISQEAIPGLFLEKLGPSDDIAAKVGFTLKVERAFLDKGTDIIAQEMGHGPIGDLSSMVLGHSAYFDGDVMQINPSRQIEIPAAAERGAENTYRWDAASKQQTMLYAVIRGMLTGQKAVAGYRRFEQEPLVAERNMAELVIGQRLTADQQAELVTRTSEILKALDRQGWEVALYPQRDGVAFMNTRHTGMTNTEFHGVIKKIADGLSFSGKVRTFAAETFYVTAQPEENEDTGKVEDPYYGEIIQGYEDLLGRVERRVAPELARIYVEYAKRGFGSAPEWAIALTDKKEALRRDAKTYPHFWHFSVEELGDEGIKREYAGTGAAGQEGARFRFDPETGKLDPESAAVFVYLPTATAEAQVVTKASFINKIIAPLKIIPTDAATLADMYLEHGGNEIAVGKELVKLGYDGIVDVDRGIVKVYRDIDASELVEGHELTAKERRAWKGALKVEDIAEGETYQHIRVPQVSALTQGDVQFVSSVLTEDGTAYFPRGTKEELVKQNFGEVRSTSVGLMATKPRRPKFSRRIDQREQAPIGTEYVVSDMEEYGTSYSPATRTAPWSLPRVDRWGRFLKRWQDSFVQFQRLNEIIESEGYDIADHINIRLQEELYHGRTQEQAARIEAKYVVPLMREMRQLAKDRPETKEQLMKKFDDYLHARHAPERNAHIREAFVNRKLTQLEDRRDKLLKRIKELTDEAIDAEGPVHEERVSNTLRWYEAQLVSIEQEMERVLNQKELTSGMTDAEAAGVMKLTRVEGLDKVFSRMAGKYVDRMLKERLNAYLDAGLVSQEEYDNVAIYKYYVPLKYRNKDGDLQDMLDLYTSMRSTNGFDVRGAELPFVTGMQEGTEVMSVLAASVNETLAAYDRIERNKVAVSLLEMAERFPNENLWVVNQEVKKRVFDKKTGTIKEADDWWARNQANVISAKRDGKTFFVTLYDPGLASAMKGLGVENLGKWVLGLRRTMRVLAQLYTTWSPEFILTNFARDWQQAIVSASTDMTTESAARIAATSHKAVRGILAANFPDAFGFLKNEYTDAYHELKEAGGKVGFFGMRGIEDTRKALLAELSTGVGVTTMRAARKVGNYISSVNEATENGIRLATYVEARRVGASKEVAASLAKNVTVNFNRRGDATGLMGTFYLFFNAGVQGVNRFFRSMKTPQGQRLAAITIGTSFMLHTFTRAIMGEDDDGVDLIDKISPFTSGRNWVIGYDKGKYVQIPMPYGFGVWGQLGKELEHLVFSGDDRSKAAGEAAVRMLSGLTTHFSPIGETSFNQGGYAMARPLIPTVLEPFMDVLANETYWGGKVYPAKAPWDQRSRSHRVYPARTIADKLTQGLTQWMNRVTGGSVYRGGVVDLNADAMTYVLDSFIGPTGRFFKRPFELMEKVSAGEDTLWNDFIILRRFLGETAPQYYVPGEFYDAIADIRSAAEEEEWLAENGSAEDVKRWEAKHGWKAGLKKAADRAQRDLREIRKRGPDTKETRDEALQLQMDFISMYLQESKY